MTTNSAQSAGRGGLAVLVAKVFFMGTGLVQQALLPRAIGLAEYGAFSRVSAVSNVFNNVVIASSTQGVSRTVAAAGEHDEEALRATLRVHGVLALVAGVLLGLVAPFVASIQHAPEILAPLLVMTGVLVVYGVYAPLVGALNGRRMFVRQATLDIIAATLRTAGLLGVGWLFVRSGGALASRLSTSPGVLGATVGAVGAATGVFLLALRWTGTGRSWTGSRPSGVPFSRAYLGLLVPVMLSQLFTNGLMQTDIFVLGRYLSIGAQATELVEPTKVANEWVGVYRACQLFAFLPYQLLFSVTQVLFPMLAKAHADGDPAAVKQLVARGSRIGAIVCGMLVCVVLALPQSLIKLAYGPEVAARGVATLRILGLGQGAFAMMALATTVLVSLRRERDATVVTGLALAILGLFTFGRIPSIAFGEAQLVTAAQCVTLALGVGLVIGATRVRAITGAFVPVGTALRVGGIVLAAWLAGGVMPVFSKLVTVVVAGLVVLAYFAALVVTRELGKEDLALVTSIVRRRTSR